MKPDSAKTVEVVSSHHSIHRHEVHAVKDCDDAPGLVEVENMDIIEDENNVNKQISSDKKTDETMEAQKPAGGYLWRISSSLIGTTTGAVTGAVGLGVGGIKWVASKGYHAGGAVVDTTKTVAGKVPIPSWKKKDKKE